MPTTSNFGWTTPADTDLVKDGAAAIRTLGNGIDTSFLDLKGGTTGQVLSKASNTDLDYTWVTTDDANAIQNAIVDAKGDLIAASAADTPARLAVGTNGQYLKADSTAATGLAWATLPASGKVLQVVYANYATQTANSTSTYADTGLTASITPSSTGSKVLVLITVFAAKSDANSLNRIAMNLVRGSTQIIEWLDDYGFFTNSADRFYGTLAFNYLDSPSSTSSLAYKVQFKNIANVAAVEAQAGNVDSSITLIEIGA